MRPAVLIIDMLHEFVRGRLRSPQAEAILPNIVKIVEKARERKIPIIHLTDAHLPTDIEVRKIWGPHAMKGSPEAKIVQELEPKTENEYIIEKRWYSGFQGTGLDELLRDLQVDTLIITGIATNICVLHTVADATYHRYEVVVIKDATAAIPIITQDPQQEHELFLTYMEKVYKAKILTTEEVLKTLEQS